MPDELDPDAARKRSPNGKRGKPAVSSPAAAGPSGSLLEGHVGAQYMLPLLTGGEARGLPGVIVDRVEFQRAAIHHPMDDVVIIGHDNLGRPATLEVQAKRTISFTASDKVFADVVALACLAVKKPSFETSRYELAVAIARTSTKIERYIHEVVRWAHSYADSTAFFERLNLPRAAHQEMRDFVSAFRAHMAAAGSEHDDAAVWRLLSRFQVLVFDFEQTGSVCTQLAHDRCVQLLEPQEATRASEMWDALQQIALEVDSVGGDIDGEALRAKLNSVRSFRLKGDRRLHLARNRLREVTQGALSGISSSVCGVSIHRTKSVAAAFDAMDRGRFVELRGAGGVGKSGILKELADRMAVEAPVVVIAPNRVPHGGWLAFASQLDCAVSAREFLTDLAGDGGSTLFIDGIDRFEVPGERATVVDLMVAATHVPGFRILVTARTDFDADARAWIPGTLLEKLGGAVHVSVGELDEDEIAWLRESESSLAALLRPGHPAEKLVRNLYRLERLARHAQADVSGPFSETLMAQQWWQTGDMALRAGQLDRRRVLHQIAVNSLTSSAPLEIGGVSTAAIEALIASGSLRLLDVSRADVSHDVLRDWAVACLLHEDPQRIDGLDLNRAAPVRLARGFELAARMFVEDGPDGSKWRSLLDAASALNTHGSWRRTALLALARSERSQEALDRCLSSKSSDTADLVSELVRAAIAFDSEPAAPRWKAMGADTSSLTADFVAPLGPTWLNLIFWSFSVGDDLPNEAVPEFVDLYKRWADSIAGLDEVSPLLVARLYGWLVEVEGKNHSDATEFAAWHALKKGPGLSMTNAQESDLRTAFLAWSKLRPAETDAYLRRLMARKHRHAVFAQLLLFVGTAPQAAPEATADLFLAVLPEGDKEDDDWLRGRSVFSTWDSHYFPASPARAPFLALLLASREHGLRLVRGVVAHAVRKRSRNAEPGANVVEVSFPGGRRSFPWAQSYMWSRSMDSSIVASALMALEGWAHRRIEQGDPLQEVIDDVVGPDGACAAFLLVAVDVLLSHWPSTRETLSCFASSAELLALDRQRLGHDMTDPNGDPGFIKPEPHGLVRLANLKSRRSRRVCLDAALFEYGQHGPAELRDAMRRSLEEDVARIGAPQQDDRGWSDPRVAAMCALNRLDPSNYVFRESEGSGAADVEYVAPPDEARLFESFKVEVDRGNYELAMRGQVMKAFTSATSTAPLLDEAIRWALGDGVALDSDSPTNDLDWIERTRLMVAVMLMRDGTPEQRSAHGQWARMLLSGAKSHVEEYPGHTKDIAYNVSAIAAVGMMAAIRVEGGMEALSELLHLAVKRETGMHNVLRAEVGAGRTVGEQLQRSLVRLGLVSALYAVPSPDDSFSGVENRQAEREAREAARRAAQAERLHLAVDNELIWLGGTGAEPEWLHLPDPRPPKARHVMYLHGSKSPPIKPRVFAQEFALNSNIAAAWLRLAADLWGDVAPQLLQDLVRHCWPWTAAVNGVGRGPDEEPGEEAFEWNEAYFSAALTAAVLGEEQLVDTLIGRIAELEGERLFDAAEAVLHALDRAWLGQDRVTDDVALKVRIAVAGLVSESWDWRRLESERTGGVNLHLAGAICALFVGRYQIGQASRCYLPASQAYRIDAALPLLTNLTVRAAGSTFVALVYLSLLEVPQLPDPLSYLARAVSGWWAAQGANREYWLDHGVGLRVCSWINTAILGPTVPPQALHDQALTDVLDILVKCGFPLAKQTEERVAAARDVTPKVTD